MKHRLNPHKPDPARPTGLSGFTLIEVMVVIVVMGIVSAMVSVNWSSFMRHQELRQDAINLHKDIMTLKARAIEHGYADTLRGGTGTTGNLNLLPNQYVVRWNVPDTNSATNPPHLKEVKVTLNSGVVIDIDTSDMTPFGELPHISSNGWLGNSSRVKIVVKPDNFNAYDSIGRIILWRPKVNARYCIQKDTTNIKPELYHQSKRGSAWRRL